MHEGGRTSQFSRIKQRPPATDLRGPKASAVSLTPRRSNLAVVDVVYFQFDFVSSAAALGLLLLPWWRVAGTWEVPVLSAEWSEKVTDITAFTYCRVSHRAGLKWWIERDKFARP